jgi:hypothetical protein
MVAEPMSPTSCRRLSKGNDPTVVPRSSSPNFFLNGNTTPGILQPLNAAIVWPWNRIEKIPANKRISQDVLDEK